MIYTHIVTEIKDDSGFRFHNDNNEAVAPGTPPVIAENPESTQAPTDVRPYYSFIGNPN